MGAATELPTALRHAVAGAERKWRAAAVPEARARDDWDRAVEALEAALRKSGRSNPSRGGGTTVPSPVPAAAAEEEAVLVTPLSPPPATRSSPPASPRPGTRLMSESGLVAVTAQRSPRGGETSPVTQRSPSTSPAAQRPPGRLVSPATVVAGGVVVMIPAAAREASPAVVGDDRTRSQGGGDGELKALRPSTPLDSEGDPLDEDAKVRRGILSDMFAASTASPAAAAAATPSSVGGGSGSKRGRLEKTRGSFSLKSKLVGVVLDSTDSKAATPAAAAAAPAPPAPQSTVAVASSAETGTPSRSGTMRTFALRALFKPPEEDGAEGGDELTIGAPTDVQHVQHVGRDNVSEADKLIAASLSRMPQPSAASGAAAAAATSPPAKTEERAKSNVFSGLFRKVGGGEEGDDSGEFVITGPTEVQHQGHVDIASVNQGEVTMVVADVIDSVKNKEKPVDVQNVYAEEIAFAEEYNPDL